MHNDGDRKKTDVQVGILLYLAIGLMLMLGFSLIGAWRNQRAPAPEPKQEQMEKLDQ